MSGRILGYCNTDIFQKEEEEITAHFSILFTR